MNTSKIISILTAKHPDKTIVKNNEDHPTEIICEIDPTLDKSKVYMVK